MNENIQCLSFSDCPTSLSIIPSSSIHLEANGGYLLFLMAEYGPPFLSLHLLSLLWYECYSFNKWLTSLRLPLWSITFLVFKASSWDCISVIAFLTLDWLDFSSFISTVRDSLVCFCALFPAQLLSLLLLFFKDFIYLFIETERERGRNTGRGRSRHHTENLTWDSIQGLQYHALGCRRH